MLEEFSAAKIDATQTDGASGADRPASSAGAGAAGASSSEPNLEDVLSDDDFAKKLQAEMAEMMGGLGNGPEMATQFDKIFKEIAAAAGEIDETAGPSTAGSTEKPAADAAASDASFQETIRRTMERMQTSGDQATAAATEAGTDDLMAEMLKSLGAGGLEGLQGGEEEFSKMLLGMMEQLTNKDILYEPMKELNDKFPEWMEKNKDKTPAEDLKRYEEQQALCKEIVAKFEEKSYSDSNSADREYIVDRMQKVSMTDQKPGYSTFQLTSTSDASSRFSTGRPSRRHAFRTGCYEHTRRRVQPAVER
jgi:peroxin-19